MWRILNGYVAFSAKVKKLQVLNHWSDGQVLMLSH